MKTKRLCILFKPDVPIQHMCWFIWFVAQWITQVHISTVHARHLVAQRACFLFQIFHISSFPGDKFIDPAISLPTSIDLVGNLMRCFMIVMYNQQKTWPHNQSGALSLNRAASLWELWYFQISPLIKVMHPFCWFTRATLVKKHGLISKLKAPLTSTTVNRPLEWITARALSSSA